MSLLDGTKRFGRGLLDLAHAFGTQDRTPAMDPAMQEALGDYEPLLRQQYNQRFRGHRAAALRNGARWYEMNDIAAAEADAEHQAAMLQTLQLAETMRARREQAGRRDAYAKAIKGFKGTPEQLAALEAMDPEKGAELLAEQAFPDPNKNKFSTTPAGQGYVAKTDNETGETVFERAPGWKEDDDTPKALRPIRSEEGDDVVFLDPVTLEELRRVPGAASRRYKPTEGQYKAAGFAARMINSNRRLSEKFKGYTPTAAEYAAFTKMGQEGAEYSTAMLKAALNKAGMSPRARQYFQSVNEWARAKLRYESGAVIAMEEIVNELNTYFAIPGDDTDTVSQKEKDRLLNNETMKHAAADSWDMWLEDHPEFADSVIPPSDDKSKTAAQRAAEMKKRLGK